MIPQYNETEARAALAHVLIHDVQVPVTKNTYGHIMIDGMRADLWRKHRNTAVFNPATGKKEV